jgi:hypothetical protein
MGQTADQIKQEIDQQREMLGTNLQQLETKVKDTMDWRTQFEQRPMAGIGLAFGAGFLLSVLIPSGDSNSSSSGSGYRYDSSNYRVQDESYQYQPSYAAASYQPSSQPKQSKPKSPEMNEITETIENIRGAVMGLAATRLRSFLAEAVPGFQDEYEEARTKRGASDMSKIDTELSTSASASSSSSSTGTTSGGNSEVRDTSADSSAPTFGTTSATQSTYRP